MGIYDVKSFFLGGGALEQLHGDFNDIGAHQDFQMTEFSIPELLLPYVCYWYALHGSFLQNSQFRL